MFLHINTYFIFFNNIILYSDNESHKLLKFHRPFLYEVRNDLVNYENVKRAKQSQCKAPSEKQNNHNIANNAKCQI